MSETHSPELPASVQDIIKKLTLFPAGYGFSTEDTAVIKAACRALHVQVPRPAAAEAPASSMDDALKALFPNWQSFDSMQACISSTLSDLRRTASQKPAVAAPQVQEVKPVAGAPDLLTTLIRHFLPRVKKAKRPMNMGLNGVPVSETPNVPGYYRVCPDGTVERWERLRNEARYISVGSFKIEGFDADDEDDNPNAPRFTPGAYRQQQRAAREE